VADTLFMWSPLGASLMIAFLILCRIALEVARRTKRKRQREELETAIKDWAKGIK
jgi:hypothetical protein